MPRKRLVLLAEGDGDVEAVHVLVNRLLKEIGPWDCLSLDPNVVRVGGVENLTGSKGGNWPAKLQIASKRRDLGAVLLVLDGDAGKVEGADFCAMKVAGALAARSEAVGGGKLFSVACVFTCQEYESILIAGVESLAGRPLPDGRPGVKPGAVPPPGLDVSPRDAKGWLRKHMLAGYRPTRDQKPLTEIVSLDAVRSYGLRSFRRLESAIQQITDGVRSGSHIVSPKLNM